jgi:hypothetical protein
MRAVDEQGDGVAGEVEWRHRQLALPGHAQRRLARDEHA